MMKKQLYRCFVLLVCAVFLWPLSCAAAEDWVVEGPVTKWNGEVPYDDVSGGLLQNLYYHVGVWRSADRSDSILISNNSMTGLDYSLEFSLPGVAVPEFYYITVDPVGRYVIFYTEDGAYEAHVSLGSYANWVSVRLYAKDPAVQERIGDRDYTYDLREPLPDIETEDFTRVWEQDWYDPDNGADLIITRVAGKTMHMQLTLAHGAVYDYDFEADDYELIHFDTPDGLYHCRMMIDAYDGGVLELSLESEQPDESTPGFEDLFVRKEDGTLQFRTFRFMTEVPPDLTHYGWMPDFGPGEEIPGNEEPEDTYTGIPFPLPEDERQDLFMELSRVRFLASSGAGAWEGELTIDASGGFSGSYYDQDYEERQEVTFSGAFGEVIREGATQYRLTVTFSATMQEPGTEAVGEYGDKIVYIDSLLPAGSEWVLNVPGTPETDVPEMVAGEFHGTYLDEEAIDTFYILSDAETGWGFFGKDPGYDTVPETDPIPADSNVGIGTPVATFEPAPVLANMDPVHPETGSETLYAIDGKPGYAQVPVSRVDATSYIPGQDPNAFLPSRVIDGEETTCWQISLKSSPLGQACLYFDFDTPVALDELWIKNGFWKKEGNKDYYLRNCRVKEMTVDFMYEEGDDYQDAMSFSLKDDKTRADWTVLSLNGKNGVIAVRVRIDQVYRGSKYRNDVAVSEIMFVQKP